MNLGKCRPIGFSLATSGLLLAGLFLLVNRSIPVARANPGDLFVKPSGSGSGCTQAQPCALETALGQAAPGERIYFAEGRYTGTGGAVITVTKSLTLAGGWDGAGSGPVVRDPVAHITTLDGEGQRRVVYINSVAGLTLDGFVITGGWTELSDFSGGGIYAENSASIIRYNQIISNTATGDGGGVFINRGSAQIVGNIIRENAANWAGGLRIINNADVAIIGNEIISNVAAISGGGMELDCCRGGATSLVMQNLFAWNRSGSAGGGVLVRSTGARLENNILAGNQAGEGAGVWLQGTATHPVSTTLAHNTVVGQADGDSAVWVNSYVTGTLVNNIFTGHSTGLTNTTPASNTVAVLYNLFWDASDPITGTNAVLADPQLDVTYHLLSGSPAIDAGTATGVAVDIDGQPRPIGPLPDIGADERSLQYYLSMVAKNVP